MLWRDTVEYVASTGVSPEKVVWFPHGVELERYTSLRPYDGSPHQPFTVMYLGGFVENNDIGTIVAAAEELQRRGRDDIAFALVGSSTNKETWVRRVAELGLRNVSFPPPVPKADIATVMCQADAFIYGVRELPLYRYGISMNKLVDYLASGRPIIFSGYSSYDPVAEGGAGYSVPPEDPIAVADAVERLVALEPAERAAMGKRGYDYLLDQHTIPVLAERLIEVLHACGLQETRPVGRRTLDCPPPPARPAAER
jgi:glycosyltransferase involved in cell wall biosynthesis